MDNQSPFWHFTSPMNAIELVKSFAVDEPTPLEGHITNFLDVKCDIRFFPGILDNSGGTIDPVPIPANWHADIAEWAAVLNAVEQSDDTFRMAELGCGWGCWMNNSGKAAKSRGKSVFLVGIEGDENYVQFAHQSLATNGFSAEEYRLFNGVAAPERGTALFPRDDVPGSSWGRHPIFGASDEEIERARQEQTHSILDMIPLSDTADSNDPLDLLHIDIQGGETDYVRDNLGDLQRLVRRMVVGTHSRQIEGELMTILLAAGWRLEIERPAILGIIDGHPEISVDGLQGWWNPSI